MNENDADFYQFKDIHGKVSMDGVMELWLDRPIL